MGMASVGGKHHIEAMMAKTAAVYLRVSTDDQTVANQTDEVTQLVLARGFEPIVYAETGSAVMARPVLDRMLSDVRAGRVNAVAVWSMDRLGRGEQKGRASRVLTEGPYLLRFVAPQRGLEPRTR